MFDHFPKRHIEKLNRRCDALKIKKCGSRSGGDPDQADKTALFAFFDCHSCSTLPSDLPSFD
jgi:hypothetical protein